MATEASISRGTRTMFVGRAVTIGLSMVGLFLYPRLLGPEAHGWFQYYLSLNLFLLGFLNGCASPMASHYVALYRVSEPERQGVLLVQLFRWYLLLLAALALTQPLLKDSTGFWWVYFAAGLAGLSQLIAAAVYGLGHLGAFTWFPVLILFLRIASICGLAAWVGSQSETPSLVDYGIRTIPVLLLVSTLPSLVWMLGAFLKWRKEWFLPETSLLWKQGMTLLPWEEIKRFGLATVIGQIIYQVFTRTLTVLAMQGGYPEAEVGYLGLATQGFGQVVFLAGIFSLSVYPWMVSSWKSGDLERFRLLQSESWRFCALLGGWLVAAMFGLIRPLVLVFLGEEYHRDLDLIVEMVRIGGVAGALMLAGEFHLRVLLAQTETQRYLAALAIGFALASPYLGWVLLTHQGMVSLTWTLPLGVGLMTAIALFLSPRTIGFHKRNLLAIAGGCLSILAAKPFEGGTAISLAIQVGILSMVYALFSWGTGLVRWEDRKRLKRVPSSEILPPEVPAE